MDDTAMRELAQHIRRTHDIREQSWMMGSVGAGSGYYRTSYDQAMVEAMAPEILHPLIFAMLVSGFADVHEWCDRILNPYGLDVSAPAQIEYV